MKDLISREALALDVRRNLMPNVDADGTVSVEDAERYFLSRIAQAPAVDAVEVVHGKWEWFEEWSPSTPEHPRECDDCGWRCGECKTALEDMVGGYWDDPYEKPQLNYCPNCGADMRVGE